MSQKPKTANQSRVASSTKTAVAKAADDQPPSDVVELTTQDAGPVIADAAPAPAEVATPAVEQAVAAAAEPDVPEPAAPAEPSLQNLMPPHNPMQGLKTMMKSTEDLVAFNQATLEAFVRSGQIWAAGVQELTKQVATTAKASLDESVSTFKAMSAAKSVKEAFDLQSAFAKTAFEKAMADSNKLADASLKLTEEVLAPITARVTYAVETFGKAA